jgi:hypothetical protein
VYRKIKIRDMRTEVCGAVHTSCSGAPFGAAFSIKGLGNKVSNSTSSSDSGNEYVHEFERHRQTAL